MANVGDGRALYESSGAGEKNDIEEEPQNDSHEAGRNVLEKDIASCAELVIKAFKCSTINTVRQDSTLITNKASDLPITSMASATMESLPDELLLDIFIRLLAKQLAQMRSVSKSWNALLSQSSFIKSHLHHSIHNHDQVLLVFYHSVCPCNSKPFRTHPSRSPHLELTEFNNLPSSIPEINFPIRDLSPIRDLPPSVNIIRVIGAVNGLICSSYGSDSVIHIWNPSLSAVLTLPPNPIPFRYPSEINLRFGFDPKNDDYKVVKLTRIPITSKGMIYLILDTIKEWLQVEVYSMQKGSWELTTARLPSHINRIDNTDNVCVDGHDGYLHWIGCYSRGKTYSKTIVAFDLGSHTFSEMPLPYSSTVDHCNCYNVIGVLAGKLCVMLQGENRAYEVWVMEEYGVAESWVKRHVISPFNYYNTHPFGFTSHNEFVIEDYSNDDCLVFHDPIANKTKFFKNTCCRERPFPDKVVEYVDSLVWVAPVEHKMVDDGGQN